MLVDVTSSPLLDRYSRRSSLGHVAPHVNQAQNLPVNLAVVLTLKLHISIHSLVGHRCIRINVTATSKSVNAVTLVSVAKADLVPAGQPPAGSAIKQFFVNFKIPAQTDSKQAVILNSMSFT